MLPALMANPVVQQAAGSAARAAVRYGAKRLATYVAGAGAAGVAGGYALGRKGGPKRPRSGRGGQRIDAGAGGELIRETVTYGRTRKEYIPKVVRANILNTVCRCYWVNPNGYDNAASSTTVPGQIPLRNFNLNGSATTIQLPLFLFDVTSWVNQQGSSQITQCPMWQLQSDVVGNLTFANYTTAASGSAPSWFIETCDAPTTSTGTNPNGRDLLKSMQLRFLFYGATSKPTRISLDVISIQDDYLHPDNNASAVSLPNMNLATDKTAFWGSKIRPYLFNPVVLGDVRQAKGKCRIHKHHEFLIQEKLSTEPNGSYTGHMHQVTMKLNLDRICDYRWNQGVVTSVAGLESAGVQTDTNDVQTCVCPRKRLYVMIRGQSTYNTGGTDDPTKTPSFDLVARGIHQIVA
jgi:hypothetical protein